jgi:hypothetical protein
MNEKEHVILCICEECGEISQEASKIGRFGDGDHPPNSDILNNKRLVAEVNDLLGVLEMLESYGVDLAGIGDREAIDRKKAKVRHYFEYARKKGTLQ